MQQLSLIASRSAGILAAIVLVTSLIACSYSETQEDSLSHATSLDEVVEAVIHTAPTQAYTIAETRYLAVITEHAYITRDYSLLKAKELMPVLLERYPDIDKFFLAWTNNGSQFLKIPFAPQDVSDVNWKVPGVKDGDLQKTLSMYWATPEFR